MGSKTILMAKAELSSHLAGHLSKIPDKDMTVNSTSLAYLF
jgi:hypothetical protein